MSLPPPDAPIDALTGDLVQSANDAGLAPTPAQLRAAEAGAAGADESAVGCTDCNEREEILKENIIVIGSERYYNAFWSKMMFIAPAVAMGARGLGFRGCDRKTVLYVSTGYTRSELLAVESLEASGFTVKRISSVGDIVSHMNSRPGWTEGNVTFRTKIHGMYFFCHGFPNTLNLDLTNAATNGAITMEASHFAQVSSDKMTDDAEIVSYACRTGISVMGEAFANAADARPQDSLAQKVATQLNVTFKAFHTRTHFQRLIAPTSERDGIAESLRKSRRSQDGQIIQIPPHYEALPHPDLGGPRAWWDGTDDYALWRKGGATELPYGFPEPTGLPLAIQTFNP